MCFLLLKPKNQEDVFAQKRKDALVSFEYVWISKHANALGRKVFANISLFFFNSSFSRKLQKKHFMCSSFQKVKNIAVEIL